MKEKFINLRKLRKKIYAFTWPVPVSRFGVPKDLTKQVVYHRT